MTSLLRLLTAAVLVNLLTMLPARGDVEGASMTLTPTSPAFAEGGEIPRRYTCKDPDISPPLAWSAPPGRTRSLALIVDDPDAPDPEELTWVHWVLYNLAPTAGQLPEAVAPDRLPGGAREGLNDWQRTGYGGPCPPIGRHRYFHKLYALDTVLPTSGGPPRRTREGNARRRADRHRVRRGPMKSKGAERARPRERLPV